MTSFSPVSFFWHFLLKGTNLSTQSLLFHWFYFWRLSQCLLLECAVKSARKWRVPSSTAKRCLQSMMNILVFLWELLLQSPWETFGLFQTWCCHSVSLTSVGSCRSYGSRWICRISGEVKWIQAKECNNGALLQCFSEELGTSGPRGETHKKLAIPQEEIMEWRWAA